MHAIDLMLIGLQDVHSMRQLLFAEERFFVLLMEDVLLYHVVLHTLGLLDVLFVRSEDGVHVWHPGAFVFHLAQHLFVLF